MSEKLNGLSRRSFLKLAAATALAASFAEVVPAVAVADEAVLKWPTPTGVKQNAVNGKTVVTCYAHSIDCEIIELLGLSNPSVFATEYNWYLANGGLSCSPTFGMWGTSANEQPNAFMSNLVLREDKGVNTPDEITAVVASALQGTTQAAKMDEYGMPLFMRPRPRIVCIAADGKASSTMTFAQYAETIRSFKKGEDRYQTGDENYNPSFVSLQTTVGQKYGPIVDTWTLAKTAQDMIDKSNGTLCARYGNPTDMAANYERLILGMQYAVLRAIDTGQVRRKVVAVVGAISTRGSNLLQTGVNVECNRIRIDRFEPNQPDTSKIVTWSGGVVTRVRHLTVAPECTCDSIVDYYPITENGDMAGKDPIVSDAKGLLWARPEVLMDCDAILIRKANNVDYDEGYIPGAEEIKAMLRNNGFNDESKWPDMHINFPKVGGWGAASKAAFFYYPFYLFFVYPEVIHPIHAGAYMYNKIFHIADTYLKDAIEINCKNTSLPTGYELSINGYSPEKIESVLNKGIEWYLLNKATVAEKYSSILMTEGMSSWLTDGKKKDWGIRSNCVMPRRITGDNSYVASANCAIEAMGGKSSKVIIVGDVVDAAIATPLAAALGVPVVAVPSDGKGMSGVLARLQDMGATRFRIVGNKSCVSAAAETALIKAGLSAFGSRITGATPTEIAVAVAKASKSWGSAAIVASSKDIPALMAISAYAAKKKAPIFIVGSKLTSGTKSGLKKFKKVTVLGSACKKTSSVYKAIPGTKTYWSGSSYTLAKTIVKNSLAAGLKADKAVFVSGAADVESACAGFLAAKNNAVVIPVSAKTLKANAALAAKKATAPYVVGDSSKISESMYEDIIDAIS